METIKVNLKNNPYNIYLGYNLINKVPSYIKKLNIGNLGIILTSAKVYSLYKDLLKSTFGERDYKIIKVIDGEGVKSKKWLFKVIEEIMKADGWGKRVFIVCLGGGTIGDLGGFAASIYKRGIPYIQIPTTLLAQIDSSIGGKTAIDLKDAKNILGTFYQPRAVFIDPFFLTTLTTKEVKEGLAEAIKYGIIRRKDFFYFLKDNYRKIIELKTSCILKLISTCVEIKVKIVEDDEKEKKGIRTILNFGHTFAHALETSCKYRKISHGEAISIGMLYAGRLSFLLGKCKMEATEEIRDIIKCFSLPAEIRFDYTTLCKAMTYDKKFIGGKVRMVLLKKIGEVEVAENIALKDIRKSLKKFCLL
ncbi:MAG: 3-dehydroquinate synthase [Candidatus Omnitrophica bacterium]|nr:3-dehydroquinate synthase [Candidatus Omnitrophota bacterium]MBU0896597.1 3-dehydroquinate synthase [Candidatus Omnitrophota bacterium]MBU1133808.1 3-dehydroquinate synthase [Candidatus Omnitrophota bacterium]MBU1809864.1 3-dehydroquinate synthase [Candidatus Omnitrophota bacterium]